MFDKEYLYSYEARVMSKLQTGHTLSKPYQLPEIGDPLEKKALFLISS